MKSFIAALRSLVLPYGATSGQRIVLDGVDGVILVFDSTNTPIASISPVEVVNGSTVTYFEGTTSYSDAKNVAVHLSREDGEVAFESYPNINQFTNTGYIKANNPYSAGANYNTGALEIASPAVAGSQEHCVVTMYSENAAGTVDSHIQFRTVAAGVDSAIQLEVAGKIIAQVISGGVAANETWHNFTLQNSWVTWGAPGDTPGYRLMPDGTVQLRGWLKNGTLADGTQIATLPAGYRPHAQQAWRLPCLSTVTASMSLSVDTNGNLAVFGLGANTDFSLDPVRFPVSTL